MHPLDMLLNDLKPQTIPLIKSDSRSLNSDPGPDKKIIIKTPDQTHILNLSLSWVPLQVQVLPLTES